jgi:AmiR/NasT family two-component response regulator
MTPRLGTPNFRGTTALVLHREGAAADAVLRQLERLGVIAAQIWPTIPQDRAAADFVFFDADRGYDEQFPWAADAAPMPLIAMLGTEAPGRIEWMLSRGADAQLLKPVGSAGVFAALVVAGQAFERRRQLAQEIEEMRSRLARRPNVAFAIVRLMEREGLDVHAALRRLRQLAMSGQRTIEDAADALLAATGGQDVVARAG